MNIALLILLLYSVLENCVFYVTMKKDIRKSNTYIAIYIILELKKEKQCLLITYVHLFASLRHIVLFV